jgi:hypothetical protein
MSDALFSLNQDLKALRDAGYFVERVGGFLIMREVPYVNANRQVKRGVVISTLCLSGDITQKPEPHTVQFDGEYPCNADGSALVAIGAGSAAVDLGHGLIAQHMFSSKPDQTGYPNYFDKMTTYANIISGPAAVLMPGISAKVFRAPEVEDASVFNYIETASARVGIGALTALLQSERVAIIGVGGTGSYILDQVAKTPVAQIKLIDDDDFLQHNAFRAPGAPSLNELRKVWKKVNYFSDIYSRMHRHIVPHALRLDAATVNLLDDTTFAFLCMDAGEQKRLAVEKLEALDVPFIDVGMGLELVDGSLGGILRVTASSPDQREHFRQRVSFDSGGADNVYVSNIQVADLNMLNAAFAVIKWKKLRGFYRDLEREHHSSYTTDGNMLLNGDEK